MKSKRLCALFLTAILLFNARAAAQTDDILMMTLKTADKAMLNTPSEIYIVPKGVEPIDVEQEDQMLVLSYWILDSGKLRLGLKEFNSPGLLVRKDMDVSVLDDGKLELRLYKKGECWMLDVEGQLINQRNWNIALPEGETEEGFRITDNIYFCTDYSQPDVNGGKGDSTLNGTLDMLAAFPDVVEIYTEYSNVPVVIERVSGAAAPETSDVRNNSSLPTGSQSQNDIDTKPDFPLAIMIALGTVLFIGMVCVAFYVIRRKK